MNISFRVPSFEIEARIKNIQQRLQLTETEGLLVVQRVDLFYFSGTAQNGFLYVPAQGDPLLLIKRYAPRAREESPLTHIIEMSSTRELPKRIMDFFGRLPETLALELDVLPVTQFRFLKGLLPARNHVDGSPLIHAVRSIKSPWEIEQLEHTARLSARTFEYMAHHLAPGCTEMEFAGLFEAFARKIGHGGKLRVRDYQSEVYPWHVLSGPNGGKPGLLDSPFSGEGTSCAFPVGAGFRRMRAHEPILIDLGFVFNGYHMDETRMFAMGTMPEKACRASQAALEIHDALLAAARPGLSIQKLYDISVKKARALGFEESYLGPPGYKVSFVGHGIGLDLVEQPILSARNGDPLQPGMVLAIEPKITCLNQFGAGMESVFTITKTGARMISRVPCKIFIV